MMSFLENKQLIKDCPALVTAALRGIVNRV